MDPPVPLQMWTPTLCMNWWMSTIRSQLDQKPGCRSFTPDSGSSSACGTAIHQFPKSWTSTESAETGRFEARLPIAPSTCQNRGKIAGTCQSTWTGTPLPGIAGTHLFGRHHGSSALGPKGGYPQLDSTDIKHGLIPEGDRPNSPRAAPSRDKMHFGREVCGRPADRIYTEVSGSEGGSLWARRVFALLIERKSGADI